MLNQDPFLDFVMQEAEKLGKIFFIDSGEGNCFIDPDTGWDVEDLSGWLISADERNAFIAARKNGTADDTFLDSYVFAKWLKDTDGKLHITFKHY